MLLLLRFALVYLYHISFHACICFRPVFFAFPSLALSLPMYVLGPGIQDDPEPCIYQCHVCRGPDGPDRTRMCDFNNRLAGLLNLFIRPGENGFFGFSCRDIRTSSSN
jgi:hypothetical protein